MTTYSVFPVSMARCVVAIFLPLYVGIADAQKADGVATGPGRFHAIPAACPQRRVHVVVYSHGARLVCMANRNYRRVAIATAPEGIRREPLVIGSLLVANYAIKRLNGHHGIPTGIA